MGQMSDLRSGIFAPVDRVYIHPSYVCLDEDETFFDVLHSRKGLN